MAITELAGRALEAARVGATLGAQAAGAGASVARATAERVLERLGHVGRRGGEPHPYERSTAGRETGEPRAAARAPSDDELAALADEEEAAALVEDDLSAAGDPDAVAVLDDEIGTGTDEEADDLTAERAWLAGEDLAEGRVEQGGEAGEAAPSQDGEAEVGPGGVDTGVEAGAAEVVAAEPGPGEVEAASTVGGAAEGDPAAREPAAAGDEAPVSDTMPAAPPAEEHVDSGAEVVAELAESGAEDGAGAEVEVAEPWPGYAGMTAAEIRRRLSGADSATTTAVVLHERANRGRKSVLDAAERRLARAQSGS